MKYYCFLFNVLVFFFFLTKINGQKQDGYELRGKVFDHENQPLPGATINVMGSKIGAISGVDGDFFLQLDKEGTYTLEISSMGFQTQQQTILINRKTTNVTIQLEEAIAELKQVVVEAASEKLTLETGALSIESIDLKIIRAEAADLPAVLNRTAGVNIRQSAGLGSRARININGLQDKAIEFFRDGIPVDYLGDAFNIALLSPNTLDRVDIYKGVIPAELGGDVLGAGLNFITKEQQENNIEFSYEHSSFNTHRPAINAFYKDGSNRFVRLLSFLNYSDNNYKVDVEIRDPETRTLSDITAERFHDTFLSSFNELQIGLAEKTWADEFSLSGGHSLIRDDVQNSPQMRQAFGRAKIHQDGVFGALNYKKYLINRRLKVDYFSAIGYTTTEVIDTAFQVVNWLGEIEERGNVFGGEISNNGDNLTEFRETDIIVRLLVEYGLSERHKLTFNNVFNRKRRVGDDPLGIRVTEENIDPLTVPAILKKNTAALEISSTWLDNKKLTTQFAVKHYDYRNSGINYGNAFINSVEPIINEGNIFGGNARIKYVVNESILLRASYERNATRIPDDDEIYGDGAFLSSNPELKPEVSNNLNIGIRFDKSLSDSRIASLELSGFIRDTENRIFARSSPFNVFFDNGLETDSKGVELDFYAEITKRFNITANVTYQDIVYAKSTNFLDDFLIGERLPNIPYFFFNSGIRYTSGEYRNKISFTGYVYQSFVEEFFLFFRPSPVVEPPVIPSRNIIRVGITTNVGNWSITTESNNVLNALVFEEFREQRPGRTWHLKVNYRLNL